MADQDEPAGELDERTWTERLGEVPPPRRPRLPAALTVVAGLGCAVVGGLQVGGTGVVAGLVAGLVVLAFFVSSPLPLALTEALGAERGTGLVLLLTNYGLRVLLALALPLVLVSAGWADRTAVGVSVIVCAGVRVNAQALLARPLRAPGGGRGGSRGSG